jgi:hypothetical protein
MLADKIRHIIPYESRGNLWITSTFLSFA